MPTRYHRPAGSCRLSWNNRFGADRAGRKTRAPGATRVTDRRSRCRRRGCSGRPLLDCWTGRQDHGEGTSSPGVCHGGYARGFSSALLNMPVTGRSRFFRVSPHASVLRSGILRASVVRLRLVFTVAPAVKAWWRWAIQHAGLTSRGRGLLLQLSPRGGQPLRWASGVAPDLRVFVQGVPIDQRYDSSGTESDVRERIHGCSLSDLVVRW